MELFRSHMCTNATEVLMHRLPPTLGDFRPILIQWPQRYDLFDIFRSRTIVPWVVNKFSITFVSSEWAGGSKNTGNGYKRAMFE